MRGERNEPYETAGTRKDGQEIYVSLTLSPVRDAMSRIVGASAVGRDLTARTLVEAALERQRRDTVFLDPSHPAV